MKAPIVVGVCSLALMALVAAGCSQPGPANETPALVTEAAAPPVSEAPTPVEPPETEKITIPEIVAQEKGELHGLSVSAEGESLALDQGIVLVAVLNAGCEHCAASVPRLNELMTAIEDVSLAGVV